MQSDFFLIVTETELATQCTYNYFFVVEILLNHLSTAVIVNVCFFYCYYVKWVAFDFFCFSKERKFEWKQITDKAI